LGFGSEIWVLTWGVHSESEFDLESSGVALIGALAPNKCIDFVLTLRISCYKTLGPIIRNEGEVLNTVLDNIKLMNHAEA
jgi:hypothetical protein